MIYRTLAGVKLDCLSFHGICDRVPAGLIHERAMARPCSMEKYDQQLNHYAIRTARTMDALL
jgi:hypothetical protein